jgi:hypothetical protein
MVQIQKVAVTQGGLVSLFQIHASHFLCKEGYTFTREQVQGMWKTLVTGLKKTKDHNNKSGNDRMTEMYMLYPSSFMCNHIFF